MSTAGFSTFLGYTYDHLGPMCRSAWDCAAMLTVMATIGLMLLASVFSRRMPPGTLPWQA